MKPALVLLVVAAASLLLLARREGGQVEAAEGDYLGGFDLAAVAEGAESAWNQLTEQTADVDMDTAGRNAAAFLKVIQRAEGTAGRGDYRVCYGYSHTINDLSDHPAVTGEWRGVRLPDGMCQAAGFAPGCVSTAAGAYQIIRQTWLRLKARLGLPDFGPESQDAAALELIRSRGALQDVRAGRFVDAVRKCRNEWASLPGNYARQGQHSLETLAAWYEAAGGNYA